MKKKEAIQHLRELKIIRTEFPNALQEQALDIAIHALETGEVYMNGKDYNLYLEGYKQGKKDFERTQGEWIEQGYLEYKCSVCGRHISLEDHWTNITKDFPFCHCGAEMKRGGVK